MIHVEKPTKKEIYRLVIIFIGLLLSLYLLTIIRKNKEITKHKEPETIKPSSIKTLDKHCSLHLPSKLPSKIKKIQFLNKISETKSYIEKH